MLSRIQNSTLWAELDASQVGFLMYTTGNLITYLIDRFN